MGESLIGTLQVSWLGVGQAEGGVLVEYLQAGGWMMYVILSLSVLGVVFFLERAVDLYLLKRMNVRRFVTGLVERIEQRRFREALEWCQIKSRHPLVKVARAGMLRANRREADIERAMENEMLEALPSLQRRVSLMALLANIATLLGLLGTIFGLISAFSSVAAASAAERQEALAAGISQAMYTTAFGISVAVPLLFFHHFLSKRAERVMNDVEGGATSVLVALSGIPREERDGEGQGTGR